MDSGGTWTAPVRVNDDTTALASFFAIAVDESTGVVAVSWYDCRGDNGSGREIAGWQTQYRCRVLRCL